MKSALLLLLLCTFARFAAVAQPTPPDFREVGSFPIQHFTPDVYQDHPQVWDIAQDALGRMYFGTTGSLLRFDGVRWQHLLLPNKSVIRSLASDAQGRVYVGGVNDLGYVGRDSVGTMRFVSLRPFLPADEPDFEDVWSTVTTSDGTFFRTHERLFRWSVDEKMTVWPLEGTMTFMSVVRDVLYLDAGGQMMRLSGDSLVTVLAPGAMPPSRIAAALPYGRDGILVTSRDDGLFLLEGDHVVPFPTEADDMIRGAWVYRATTTANGYYVLATIRKGAYVITPTGRLVTAVTADDDLGASSAYNARVDDQGDLWLGTNNGITRMEVPSPFSYFDTSLGIQGSPSDVLRIDSTIYVATSAGIYRSVRHTGTPAMTFTKVPGMDDGCWALERVGDDVLAGCQYGVFHVTPQGTTVLRRSDTVFALKRSIGSPDRVFVGMRGGLALLRHDGQRWVDEGVVPGTESTIRYITQDDGGVWLGRMTDGILRVQFPANGTARARVTHYAEAEGVPTGWTAVFTFHGEVLVTSQTGLYRFNPDAEDQRERFVPDSTFGARYAGGHLRLWLIKEDSRGDPWLAGADNAIYRQQEDGTYLRDVATLAPLYLDKGITMLEPDVNGIMWIGRSSSLIRYDPSVERPPRADVSTMLERVTTIGSDSLLFDDTPGPGDEPITLDYAHNAIRLAFAAPFYDDLANTQYQYRLEGFDDDWSSWTDETHKDYTNLPEGDYRFSVRARNLPADTATPAAFAFTILPPWHRTWWARSLFALGVLLVLALAGSVLLRYRTARLEARTRELERRVAQRTAQLERQKTALERANVALKETNERNVAFLGIAAHDLKNPLHNLQGFAGVLLEDGATLSPEAFQEQAMEALPSMLRTADQMTKVVQGVLSVQTVDGGTLRPELDRVDLGASTRAVVRWNEPRAAAKDIDLHLMAEPDVVATVDEKMIQRALDNLIGNAVKFSPPGTRVTVRLAACDAQAVIAVKDEGPGLSAADQRLAFRRFQRLSARPTDGESSTGLGLYIVRSFVEAHGGTVTIDSTPGHGATFTITLPLTPHTDSSRDGRFW